MHLLAQHDPAHVVEALPAWASAPTGHVSGAAALIPFLPLLGCVLAGLCAAFRVKSKLPAWITVGCLGVSFALTLKMYFDLTGGGGGGEHVGYAVVKAWDWINFQWGGDTAHSLVANFSFYIDSLTCLWMLFVTGLATLIALYASEYMAGDVGAGYCRFFAAFCLFVFSMACLVMGDNLILLYLGWEGVGLCSYLLIGYFYKKPSAVAAAKKAFVMNRIGDLGLAMGIMLTFVQFGTVEYDKLFPMIQQYLAGAVPGPGAGAADPGAPDGGGVRQVGAAVPVCVAPGRDGRPDAGFGADPRRDDGHRGCVPGRPVPAGVPGLGGGPAAGGVGRGADGVLGGDDRDGPVRHQADHGVFDGVAARIHVRRAGRRRRRGGRRARLHPCVLQGPALPRVRRRDARLRRPARSAEALGPCGGCRGGRSCRTPCWWGA